MKQYSLNCNIAQTLNIIGDRWSLLILHQMFLGKETFKEIQDSLEGIPTNLLSERLKTLEVDNLVKRSIYQSHPPRYNYILTDKGMESIDSLKENLSKKAMEYSLYDEINFDYKITEKLIEVTEEVSFINKNKTDREKLFNHKDLSIVYFDSKYKLDDVIKSLEDNNFKCNINK